METDFAPFASAGGGALIGAAAVFLMLTLGRVMGATGILSGAIFPVSREDFTWRAAVILGMMTGPALIRFSTGTLPVVQVPSSTPLLVLGGLLVGFGVFVGGGCTSGHGVCGVARFSPRSVVATLTFMVATFATVYVVRHVMGGW